MGQGQNADHGPAGGAGREAGRERLEGSGVGLPGEELIAVDEPQQRHRLALQRVDDMPVVDDMTMLAMGMSSTSSQRHLRRTAQIDLEAIVVEADTQPVANEARGHAIEDLALRRTKPLEEVTVTMVSS